LISDMTPTPEGLYGQRLDDLEADRPTAMQDFPNYGHSSSLYESRPEVFPDMLDSINSESIDVICLNQVVHPAIQRIDHMRVLGIKVGHTFRKPTFLSADFHTSLSETDLARTAAGLPNL
jgi:hypothetical protein